MLSPNGGEVWEIGKTYEIKWTGDITDGAIYLYKKGIDGGIDENFGAIFISYLKNNTPNPVWWTISSAIQPGDYFIGVSPAPAAWDTRTDYSDAPFSIAAAGPNLPDLVVFSFTATSDSVPVNQKVRVTLGIKNIGNAPATPVEWKYTNQSGGFSYYVSNSCGGITLNTGESCQVVLDFTFPTSGSKSLSISIDQDNKVIESNEANNTSNLILNVTSIPSITVLSPNGGEVLEIGKMYEIKWSNSTSKEVGIDLFSAEISVGQNGNFPRGNYPNTQTTYNWTISSSTPSGFSFKICLNTYDGLISDCSDGVFTIAAVAPLPATQSISLSRSPSDKGTESNPWKVGDTTTYKAILDPVSLQNERFDIYQYRADLTNQLPRMANKTMFEFGANCNNGVCSATGVWENQYLCTQHNLTSKAQITDKLCLSGTNTCGTMTWWADCTPSSTSSITVLSPNGGEVWEIGKTYEIKWTGDITDGAIYLYKKGIDGGIDENFGAIFISYLKNNTPNPVWWTISSAIQPGDYFIGVSPAPAAWDTRTDYSDAPFSIAAAGPNLPDLVVFSFTATSDSVPVNQKVRVTLGIKNIGNAPATPVEWKYTNQSGGFSYYVSNSCGGITLNTGESCQVVLDFTFPTSGSKSLSISIDQDNKVIESNEANNTSNLILNVTSIPSITVLSPNGGEVLEIGKMYEIKWSNSTSKEVGIDLFSAEISVGQNGNFPRGNYPNTQTTYNWTISSSTPSGFSFKICLNTYDGLISDCSDGVFTIAAVAPLPATQSISLSRSPSDKGTESNPWKVGDTTTYKAILDPVSLQNERFDIYQYRADLTNQLPRMANKTMFEFGANCNNGVCSATGVWENQYLCTQHNLTSKAQITDKLCLSGTNTCGTNTWWADCGTGTSQSSSISQMASVLESAKTILNSLLEALKNL